MKRNSVEKKIQKPLPRDSFFHSCLRKFIVFVAAFSNKDSPLYLSLNRDVISYLFSLFLEVSLCGKDTNIFKFPEVNIPEFGAFPLHNSYISAYVENSLDEWSMSFSDNVPSVDSIKGGPYALSLENPDWTLQFPKFSGIDFMLLFYHW